MCQPHPQLPLLCCCSADLQSPDWKHLLDRWAKKHLLQPALQCLTHTPPMSAAPLHIPALHRPPEEPSFFHIQAQPSIFAPPSPASPPALCSHPPIQPDSGMPPQHLCIIYIGCGHLLFFSGMPKMWKYLQGEKLLSISPPSALLDCYHSPCCMTAEWLVSLGCAFIVQLQHTNVRSRTACFLFDRMYAAKCSLTPICLQFISHLACFSHSSLGKLLVKMLVTSACARPPASQIGCAEHILDIQPPWLPLSSVGLRSVSILKRNCPT